MLLRQLKFNFGFINANVYPLAVTKSKPDLRLSKGRFEFRGPVTPGDGSGATSDKPNSTDENLQPRDRLSIRTSKNANLQPASEKNVISDFAHEVYVLRICAPNLKQCIRRAADSSFGLEPGRMNYDQRPLRKGRRGGYTAVGLSRFAERAQPYRRK